MSHLSDIGFRVETTGDVGKIIFKFQNKAENKKFGKNFQFNLKDESGAVFYWYGRKKSFFVKEKIIGFIPAFKGEISQKVKVVHLLPNKKFPLEPSLRLWIYNNKEEYPLIVDMPNYLEIQRFKFEDLKEIHAVLFAQNFEYFTDEDEFFKKYPKGDNVSVPAPGMFIPTGTFSPKNDPKFKEQAKCWCYGRVIKEEKLENKLTGEYFYHFIMKTYAADYDVVVDVKDVNTKPNIGAIIGGEFWICAII